MAYDDETLMAYADGELDETTRAEIARAVAQDPQLARRVEQHRALRQGIAGAYAGVLDQAIPDGLREAARAPRASDTPARGNVVKFPVRGTSAPAVRWRAREWTAVAASLVLGGLLSWQFLARGSGDIGTSAGAMVARGALARALESQLASNQSLDAAVQVGLSFKSRDGVYCRTFALRATSTAGLACRENAQWRVPFTESVDRPSGEIRQAATTLTPALLQAVQARIEGEPLNAEGERAAREAQWLSQ